MLFTPYRIVTTLGVAVALAGCSSGSQTGPPTVALQSVPLSSGTKPEALLYVADQPNQRVVIFSQERGIALGTINDAMVKPDGLYVDIKGRLYVCNFGSGTVTEYPKGQAMHDKTLTGSVAPKYVVAGRDGTVYVSDFNGGSSGNLYEYAHGSTTPTTTIAFTSFPAGVALDKHNKLYVAYNDTTNNDLEVVKFTPGKTNGENLGIHITPGSAGGLTFDRNDNLLLVNAATAQIDVFPPGATVPTQQIGGLSEAYQIALNHANRRLFVSSGYSASVEELTYPYGTPVQGFTNPLNGAFGVATSPASPY